jgi:hypothetical protein
MVTEYICRNLRTLNQFTRYKNVAGSLSVFLRTGSYLLAALAFQKRILSGGTTTTSPASPCRVASDWYEAYIESQMRKLDALCEPQAGIERCRQVVVNCRRVRFRNSMCIEFLPF